MSEPEPMTAEYRQAFVAQAREERYTMTALCRAYGISRKTGYQWLARANEPGGDLSDRSRRPHTSPRQTPPEMEARVVALRQQHPGMGSRKLRQILLEQGVADVPSASTITTILHRHGLLPTAPRSRRGQATHEEASPQEP